MVFETLLKGKGKKKEKVPHRCKSVDSGVSVALSKKITDHNKRSLNNEFNDIEDEQLDFEPEIDDDGNFQSQSALDESQHNIYNSNHSTLENFDLESEDVSINSTYTSTVDNCSLSNVSIGHRRYMLPVPPTKAADGRQNMYLPLHYPSSMSARTTLDSSSGNDSEGNFDEDDLSKDQSSQLDDEIEDSSSPCSISQEEEDKLLNTSSEEEDTSLEIDSEAVETCQIGSARITLPKFVNISVKDQSSNDLKRTTSTAKLKTAERKQKKKKWDLPFKPEHPITRLFLNDIGYISEREEGRKMEDSKNLIESSLGSLIVICNKDKITCEQPRGSSPREVMSTSPSENSGFKCPLPPAKRPPTRPKRTVHNREEFGKNLQIQFNNRGDKPPIEPQLNQKNVISKKNPAEDDAISIIASTIGADNMDDVADTRDLDDMSSDENEEIRVEQYEYHNNYSEDRVKEWIQSVPNQPSSPSPQLDISNVTNVLLPVPPLVSPPDEPTVPSSLGRGVETNNQRVNFKDVPYVFNGLCYRYYFNLSCTRPSCTQGHFVHREKMFIKLKDNPSSVLEAFQFALRFEKFFNEAYPAFIRAFGVLKMQNELMVAIKQFLKLKEFDCTEAIAFVISALQESGLSFLEAVEMISYTIGFLEHPVLADILLDLITRKFSISENWNFIKKIARFRGKIEPSMANKILNRAMSDYPVNKDLCLEIYNFITKSNMTDVSKISEEILTPYRTLLGFPTATVATIQAPSYQNLPLPNPNVQESLDNHIKSKLIKERQRFERKVEGTTVRARPVFNSVVTPEPLRNLSFAPPRNSAFENHSSSSDSDDRYFLPSPRPDVFPGMNQQGPFNNLYFRNDCFSLAAPSTSTSVIDVNKTDPNIALNFQPPSVISEYVPTTVRRSNERNEHEVQDPVNLTPSRPIFGRPCYRSDFCLDKSLHNLLPDTDEQVTINEKDVEKLSSVIKSKNGPEFYNLLQYYNNPHTLANFITMTIAELKSGGDIHSSICELVKSLEPIKPDYAKDRIIKGIIEVIVMNLLFEMERKGQWKQAVELLQLFCDWDSLVSSKIFSMRSVTHMGRYIFLAKIFAKAKIYHFTYEILQCPDLKLLGLPNTWPYFCNPQVDLVSRNNILRDFLKTGHRHYIVGVADIYKRIYKYGALYGYNAREHFNPMLTSIINENQISLLKHFHNDIDIFYKVMDKNNLRAFMILLASQITQENVFRLYEYCCEKQIYQRFEGGEDRIIVRNNMFDVELQVILSYYFYKIAERRQLPRGNVTIEIGLPKDTTHFPKMLQTCIRSMSDVNQTVKKILKEHFSITIEGPMELTSTIPIRRELITQWLQCNQRWFPIYS